MKIKISVSLLLAAMSIISCRGGSKVELEEGVELVITPVKGLVQFYAAAQKLTVDWGDGVTETYTPVQLTAIGHTYGSNQPRTIRMKTEGLTLFGDELRDNGDGNYVVGSSITGRCSALRFGKSPALKAVSVANNELAEADIRHIPALETAYFDYNRLTALDLTGNAALTVLWCNGNRLTALDVSRNTALLCLWCGQNPLTALDVSRNTALEALMCEFCALTALDISKNTALTGLRCTGNSLTALNISKNTALKVITCSYNQLTSLDVSRNTELTGFGCDHNQLTALDVSANSKLKRLGVYRNPFTAAGLDAVFGSLPFRSSGEQIIYIVEAQILLGCDKSIAATRGWEVVIEQVRD
jgi:Leucine-rich repeat (LRR) protein